MSELSTLARPYAEAVFRMAQGENDLAGGSSRGATLAASVSDAQVARLSTDPAVSVERVAGLVIDVAGGDLGERGANIVKVLAENDRLSLLPEVCTQFETLKANAEGTLEATITSAQELTQAQVDDLVAGLKAKFNRSVNVQVAVDHELIGGAVIAIGEQVIDGSVKGRLQRMAYALQGRSRTDRRRGDRQRRPGVIRLGLGTAAAQVFGAAMLITFSKFSEPHGSENR